MTTSYEVRCGARLISFQHAHTEREALVAYLRSVGCREQEITGVALNAVSWRGAVYRAVPLGSE